MPIFTLIKRQVIQCLTEGHILHEARNDIDVKNLLATGSVSIEKVICILKRCRGSDYESSAHHMDAHMDVHVVKTRHQGEQWYIKWYFIEPDSVFISVHH